MKFRSERDKFCDDCKRRSKGWLLVVSLFLLIGLVVSGGQIHGKQAVPALAANYPKDDITFGRIDSMGDKCAIVYGNLSFGGSGFVIKDCVGAQIKKTKFSVGYVRRMFFESESVGWFVIGGELVSVKNVGSEFKLSPVSVNRDVRFNDVFFISESIGWACGVKGVIYKTEDGGITWRKKESSTDIGLEKIQFINALEGWANGIEFRDDRRLSITLVTRDGGNSWATLNETGVNLFPVFFTSLSHGCGINDNNDIVCTNDGDQWQVVDAGTGTQDRRAAIFFVNEKQGWVAGDRIWYTADAGKTWKQQLALPKEAPFMFEHIVFSNDKVGWARTLTEVWRTTNGGTSWKRVSDEWVKQLGVEKSDSN
jgi:photosystem II stability/assembly factor-like uncharacterized protein